MKQLTLLPINKVNSFQLEHKAENASADGMWQRCLKKVGSIRLTRWGICLTIAMTWKDSTRTQAYKTYYTMIS